MQIARRHVWQAAMLQQGEINKQDGTRRGLNWSEVDSVSAVVGELHSAERRSKQK
jgi:hypothetical protein